METKPLETTGAAGIPEAPKYRNLPAIMVQILGYGLFWSWNMIFLVFMFLGFAPTLWPYLWPAVQIELIPAAYLVYIIVITLIPAIAVVLGLTVFRRKPLHLLAFGYGFEGPLMLGLLIRCFVIREITPAVTLLIGVALLGMGTFLWELLDSKIAARPRGWGFVRMMGTTLLLVIGLYVAVWGTFYAIPLLTQLGTLLTAFVENLFSPASFFMISGSLLFLYTATLLVGLPVALPFYYARAWWHSLRDFTPRTGRPWALGLSGTVIAGCVLLFVLTNQQPQHRAFALLKEPPANLQEAQTIGQQEEQIRTGLLNAYLAPYRYLSAVGEVWHVRDMYESTLKLSRQQSAQVEILYDAVARPLLYEPAVTEPYIGTEANRWNTSSSLLTQEPAQAAKLYAAYFDRPITEGERATVIGTVRDTWDPNRALAGWQAVDDREVQLVQQALTVTEHGDWAQMELFEVYQNQSATRQEVVYYFNLPESAVLTGLWLDDDPDPAERFEFHVAPRGAAQQVYRNEVRYQRDPALLEQVGPRQYRLRVFPIEPQSVSAVDSDRLLAPINPGPPVYLWMTWEVLARRNAWPLPHLSDQRNVYWDGHTQRTLNNQPWEVDSTVWLPDSIPARRAVQPTAHRVDFPGGQSVVFRPATESDQPELPGDLRLAVVLDRSRSMADHAAEVQAALQKLGEIEDAAAVDIYLTASAYRGEPPSRTTLAALNVDTILYSGGQDAAELLNQFTALQKNEPYDAVLVLTDNAGYEASEEAPQTLTATLSAAPLWMVHLNDSFPTLYNDAVMEALQASGGGATGSLDEALARMAVGLSGKEDVVDGYVWMTLPTSEAGQIEAIRHTPTDPIAPIAARRLILAEMRRQRGKLTDVKTLDALHAIAIEQGIVTPYSSMLVLVSSSQEALLRGLSDDADRFAREQEAVGETQAPVTGVPEPEEWLLIITAAGLFTWYTLSKKRRTVLS